MISGVLSSVLPIMVTIGIGILCNKINLLSRNGTGEIKKFITSIALPAAVFHALATAEYNKNMMILFLCMMIVLFIISDDYGKVYRVLLRIDGLKHSNQNAETNQHCCYVKNCNVRKMFFSKQIHI